MFDYILHIHIQSLQQMSRRPQNLTRLQVYYVFIICPFIDYRNYINKYSAVFCVILLELGVTLEYRSKHVRDLVVSENISILHWKEKGLLFVFQFQDLPYNTCYIHIHNFFFQANVGSVIEQLDTLQELKCKFESDIQEYGRNSTQVLEKSIKGK